MSRTAYKSKAKPPLVFRVNTESLRDLMDSLEADLSKAVRPAAQAAAQVLYDEVKLNVSRIKAKTGNLNKSIYQAYSAANSEDGKRATYHVSWNWVKAPHGHLVEYGHLMRYKTYYDEKTGKFVTNKKQPLAQPKQIAAKPFMRPAVSKFNAAEAAAKTTLLAIMSGANPVFGGE